MSETEIMTAIDGLENKHSYGHDVLSNKIRKFIKLKLAICCSYSQSNNNNKIILGLNY